MLVDKTLTMNIKVVDYLVLFAPVRNPPEVAPFTFQIDVPAPLPPPLSPPFLPLITEPLPLIAPPPSPSGWVSDKEDYVLVEFHQKKSK